MTALLAFYFMFGIGGIVIFLIIFSFIDKWLEFTISWIRKIATK